MLTRGVHPVGLALVVLLGGCGDDGTAERDAGVDGGRDAGRDGGIDGGFDAGRDGGRDAGHDSGLDAGPNPLGWTPMPGLREGCFIDHAEHPEALLSQRWIPCPGYDEGCLLLETEPWVQHSFDTDVGWFDGETGYFQYVQAVFGGGYGRTVALMATDGRVLGAWREPDNSQPGVCQVWVGAVGDGWAVMEIESAEFDGARHRSHLYHVPIEEIGRVTEPTIVLEGSTLPGSMQEFAVSRTTIAARFPGAIGIVEDGEIRFRGAASDPVVRGIPQRPVVVGQHVLWQDWVPVATASRYRVRLAHASFDDAAAFYFEPAEGDLRAPSTDGMEIAWLQGYDRDPDTGDYPRLELWTSTYGRHPEDIAPRKVADVPNRGEGASGGGHHALPIYERAPGGRIDRSFRIYELATGRYRAVRPPEGWVFTGEILYLSEPEFLAKVMVPFTTRFSLVRIDPRTIPYQ